MANSQQLIPQLFIIPSIAVSAKTRSLPSVHRATNVRLGRIVRLLMSHATVVVSGTKIAEEIGTTRSEVWRLIQQLRGLGVDVAGHPATGYRLRAVPDLLLPEMLAPSLKGTIFGGGRRVPQGLKPSSKQSSDRGGEPPRHPKSGAVTTFSASDDATPHPKTSHATGVRLIHHYYKIGSTNLEAMRSAAAAARGQRISCRGAVERAGRGEHSWHSARSAGIYCSVILRPALPPSDALIFSLAAGLAVRAAVAEIAPQPSGGFEMAERPAVRKEEVLWILTEMNAEATRVRHLVLGVGINSIR